MTVKQLIKKLQEFDKQYPDKRFQVFIDTQEAKAKFNDVFEIIKVDTIEIKTFEIGDGDGFGTGKYSQSVVLY